jgi:hypothetical protein
MNVGMLVLFGVISVVGGALEIREHYLDRRSRMIESPAATADGGNTNLFVDDLVEKLVTESSKWKFDKYHIYYIPAGSTVLELYISQHELRIERPHYELGFRDQRRVRKAIAESKSIQARMRLSGGYG